VSNTVNIYCKNRTARHDFVFSLLFEELLGAQYQYVNDSNQALLNYSNESLGFGINCIPHGLLSEDTIRASVQDEISFEAWGGTSCFFKTGSSTLPFDLFSATFYLVSRYEEYLDHTPDVHLRFSAESSVLLKNKVLDKPLVNLWALALKEIMLELKPQLKFKPRSFQFISTLDIDQAWKFKHKGIIRNVGGFVIDLISLNTENLKARIPVILGIKTDPFYNFEWQKEVHSKEKIQTKYFFLLGNYSRYDKNTSYRNRSFKRLIKEVSLFTRSRVGIHPSYLSNMSNKQLKKEFKRLNNVTGKKPTLSRQHYLMHKMPETYQNLVAFGIKEEHTMGYSTHLGFRAGIAAPFHFFDLSTNTKTDMVLYPFCAMDITPLHYRNENPTEAILTLKNLMNQVKEVGGLFIPLWHNESLSESGRWKDWRKVYQFLLEESNSSLSS
jgi:hypothetical protein